MEQLKNSKRAENSVANTSPERTMKAAGQTGATGMSTGAAFVEGSPIDVLLFGLKKQNSMAASFGQTTSSADTSSINVVMSLKHLIKTCAITRFDISAVGVDGRARIKDDNNTVKKGTENNGL